MPSNLELSNQLRVAEYNALRSEINNRTTAQHTVLSLNLTIAAAVSSIAFGNTGNVHIVFVLPVICPLLGLLYLDHANAIVRLGEKAWTIYNDVGPHVPERLKGEATERYAHGFALVIGAMFLAIPVLALVVGTLSVGQQLLLQERIVLGCGIACTLTFGIAWWTIFPAWKAHLRSRLGVEPFER